MKTWMEWKGFNCKAETFLSVHIMMQKVYYLCAGKKWITFDRSYHIGFGDPAPLDTTPPGLWSAKSPFPMIQSSLWGLELLGHGKPFWKPLISPTTNLDLYFWILGYNLKFWGSQISENEGELKLWNSAFLSKQLLVLKNDPRPHMTLNQWVAIKKASKMHIYLITVRKVCWL